MQIEISGNTKQTLQDQLSEPQKILIITHQNPDGDAIGSALGLYNALKGQGHQIDVMIPNQCPEFLTWMPGKQAITVFNQAVDKAKKIIENASLIFCVDFNSLPRIADVELPVRNSSAFKVLIDHHPQPEDFADICLSDTSVSSTAELIYEFIDVIFPEKINLEAATCLFAGIYTDTGGFNHNSSTPRTFEIVAALLKLGINKDEIIGNIYDNYSEYRLRLMGYCLNDKMQVFGDFHTAYISLDKSEMDRFHFEKGDTEGFVNLPLSIKGICFSALFTENTDYIRISFRSKGSFDVNQFARDHFNGGGHRNAAGGKSYVSMSETLATFTHLLSTYKAQLEGSYQ
jgi:bifunctional oligoribonuclease and PAP phosphatase NrnA